jgi:hypothetical protein
MYKQSNAIIYLKCYKAKLIYIYHKILRIYLNNLNLVEMGNALDSNSNSILNGVKCLVISNMAVPTKLRIFENHIGHIEVSEIRNNMYL